MNKFEKFADAMSKQLYQMRISNNILTTDDNREIPETYINKIFSNDIYIKDIKRHLRMSVLNDVTSNPDNYDMCEDEYVYSGNIYKHACLIDIYIKNLYIKDYPIMETRVVCDICGSDNVQSRAWVRPNKNNKFVDLMSEEIQDNFCDDCCLNTSVSDVEKNVCHVVIGFQVIGENGSNEEGKIHPQMDMSSSVYNLDQANDMLNDTDTFYNEEQWQLLSVWTNDIEKPVMMFEGSPRD